MRQSILLGVTLVVSALSFTAHAAPVMFTEDFTDGFLDDSRLVLAPSPTILAGPGQGILWAPGNLTDVLFFSFNLTAGATVESVEFTFTDQTSAPVLDFVVDAISPGNLVIDSFEDTDPIVGAPLTETRSVFRIAAAPIDSIELRAFETILHSVTVTYVPEPGSFALLTIGGAVIASRTRSRRS